MTLPGIILKAQSGFFTVRTEMGDYTCHLRGKLKHKRQRSDLATVGDNVEITAKPDGTGMIETVAPRRSALSRRAATGHNRRRSQNQDQDTEQIILANPDQVILVFACAEPPPRLRMLDRFLVIAQAACLPAVICVNKVDLADSAAAHRLFDLYAAIGYMVVYTSAATGTGINELREILCGKLSVFTGPSGVGKSSLLNCLQPQLGIKARAVSQSTAQGRHTTVHPELFPLDSATFVADTPGLRTLDLWDIEPEELDGYFIEISPYVTQCEFNDCTHTHEPNCGVRRAVDNGEISASRYESYCRLRAGDF